MSRGVVNRVEKIATYVATKVARSMGFNRASQAVNQGLSSGEIKSFKGNTATVELADGRLVTAELSGNQYAVIGGQVNILGDIIV